MQTMVSMPDGRGLVVKFVLTRKGDPPGSQVRVRTMNECTPMYRVSEPKGRVLSRGPGRH